MPPAGGYESIKYKRNLPIRGPGGAVIFGTVIGICALGFWRIGEGNLEKRYVSPRVLTPMCSWADERSVLIRFQRIEARVGLVANQLGSSYPC
jgi:hypothetical protein